MSQRMMPGVWLYSDGKSQKFSKSYLRKLRKRQRRKQLKQGISQTDRPQQRKNWKQLSQEFYASDEWKKLRYKVLQKHGARCQCCGATPSDGKKMHVDHIKPRYRFPELSLVESNLQVLCEDCNLGKGAWDQTDWRDGVEGSTATDRELDRRFREQMSKE